MFSKSKVSQSMIDAVNKVLGEKVEEKEVKQPEQVEQVKQLDEASEKVPTPTGMKVYGSSYGNSKKARSDQTKSSVDTLKGPKEKEMKEAAKPDFLDMDKDGNKKESMKKAIADKGMEEELKGNQHKIDANKNNKIDAQDFKILRNKKVREDMTFANKLLETVRKSDVPAYLRKAKGDTPLTVADVKGPKKDSISAPENLAKNRNEWKEEVEKDSCEDEVKKHEKRMHGKDGEVSKHVSKMHKEELESLDEKNVPTSPEKWAKAKAAAKSKFDVYPSAYANGWASKKYKAMGGGWKSVSEELTEEQLDEMLNEVLSKDATAGDWISDFIHSDNPKFAGKSKAERKKMALGAYYAKQNEEVEQIEERDEGKPGLMFKKIAAKASKEYGSKEAGNRVAGAIRKKVLAKEDAEQIEEITIAGTPGWEPIKGTDKSGNIKDKSGAVHTPMSRARDLARAAFKKIQKEVK